MICTNCGAHLMDSDQFCPKCGTKAIKDRRCPDCGAVLREGTKFCHKCGRPINDEGSTDKVPEETLGIPVDAIERNILSETAAEIKADRRAESTHRKTSEHTSTTKSTSSKSTASHGSAGKSAPSKNTASHGSVQKNKPVKNAPPQKKRVNYREEEDWEEEDWDDDDWDDEEGVDIITIMTAIVGCVILVVVAMLGYHLYRQYVPKNYNSLSEDSGEERQKQETDEEQQGQTMEDNRDTEINESEANYTLTVIQNVNVRDNPSTSGTNVLKVAKEGETYPCYGGVEGEEWYEILLEDGSIGYVFHEYVTVE